MRDEGQRMHVIENSRTGWWPSLIIHHRIIMRDIDGEGSIMDLRQ